VNFDAVLTNDGFDRARKFAYDQPLKLNLCARVVDIDSDQVSTRIVIENHAFRNLSTLVCSDKSM
jgi:hypothetical protein